TATTVVFNTGGKLAIDMTPSANDVLHINGTLNLIASGDILQLNITGTLTALSYTIATYSGVTGVVNNIGFDVVNGLPAGYTLVYNPFELDLVKVTPVPEPSTWLGAALAIAAFGF